MAAPFTALDEFGFHQQLAATPGIALVIFTSQGCSSCRAWKTLLAQNHLLHPEFQLFEVDAGHAQALAREFEVLHLPALFLYRDGRYYGAVQCEANPARLESAITRLLSAGPQDEP